MFQSKYIFILFFFFVTYSTFSQKEEVEKLKIEILKSKEDSNKVLKIIKLGQLHHKDEYLKAIQYYKSAIELSIKIKYIKGQIVATNAIGDEHWYQTNYDKAFQNYYKAYRLSDSINDEAGEAISLYNLGWIACIQQHNYKEDKYLYKSLQISSKLNSNAGLLRAYNALGSYYMAKFTDLKEKNFFDSAVVYSNKGIELAKRIKAYKNLAVFYINLGDLFYNDSDYKSSKFYVLRAMEIYQNRQDSTNLVFSISRIARCDIEIGEVVEALKTLRFVLDYSKKNESKELEEETLFMLANGYYKAEKFKEGFNTIKEYEKLKEELDKKAYATSISNLESNYSLEKSEVSVSQLTQANEIQELKNKKKSYFIFALVVIGLVVIVVAFLLFRQNKLKQLTNLQLKEQNQIIIEKKLEIDHSIQYAKGIQLAILPELNELKDRFAESFVYYKPKDVVSGDFYWFGKVDMYYYCLVADCTGHGVPGALMSIIGMDKIVQAIFEKGITEPNKILSYLNVQIKNVLKQHSDASIQKDGMDIALLRFSSDNSSVDFAAANRPLYLIREGALIEYKADKTAIAGFTPNTQEFTNQKIALHKNDCLFISTDGYADQFGGPEGKKMMTKKLKNVLISVSTLSAKEQKTSLENNFEQWKGSHEQVDDVLLIGIKI